MHDWDWSKGNKKPKRKKGNPLPGAKELEPEKGKEDKEAQKDENGEKEKIDFSETLDAAKITAVLETLGIVVYFIVSEGSRVVFPIRNLIPVP